MPYCTRCQRLIVEDAAAHAAQHQAEDQAAADENRRRATANLAAYRDDRARRGATPLTGANQ